jgi:DNA primase
MIEINEDVIAQVRAVPIPEYLTRVGDFVPSLKGGDFDLSVNNVCMCPMHDEVTPSFRYYEGTNTCACFGCRRGGDVVNLHREIMFVNEGVRVTFTEAVKFLHRVFVGESAGLTLNTQVQERESKVAYAKFVHLVLNRVSIENARLAEDLSLLIRLNHISGDDAITYYNTRAVR